MASMDDYDIHGLVYARRAPTANLSIESNGMEYVSKGINEAIARPVTVTRKATSQMISTERWFWLETVT